MDQCYAEGIRYSRAVMAVLGVQHRFRSHRGHLPRTWEACPSWRMELPIKSRVPMPGELLKAYTTTAFFLGFFLDTKRASMWLPLAVCMQMGFTPA